MDVEATIDAEIAAALSELPIGNIDFGTWTIETVPSLREMMSAMPPPPEPPPTIERYDVVVPGPAGASDPSVRVYRPRDRSGPLPCLYWIHGGGYLFGSALTDDPRLARWADELACVVVSIDYRLAPEHPYPAPLDDCYAGLLWVAQHADELGIDPQRIAIGGASAGGGLAAALVLLARDKGEVDVWYQLLIYPMIDDRNVDASSMIDGAPIWSRAANLLGWRAYLGDLSGDGRRSCLRGRGARHRAGRAAADVHRRRHPRRVPRRGHRLRPPAAVRGCPDRAPRVPRGTTRLRVDRARHRRRRAVPARHRRRAPSRVAPRDGRSRLTASRRRGATPDLELIHHEVADVKRRDVEGLDRRPPNREATDRDRPDRERTDRHRPEREVRRRSSRPSCW